jgi:glycogen(starch) synthase
MYQSADLVVMPSVSEPFGLVPLEAMQHGTPSLISKQSGVAEVLTHALKVDFWDVDEMANQILATLRYTNALRTQLKSWS